MRIVTIHGQSHKGSTYHIAHDLAEKLSGETTEFFLPKDFGEFCVGCCKCFTETEKKCPHYSKLAPITNAMDTADIIILASPVYVYHVTGAMKAFLDHYGYRWMVHRPEERMFKKQGVCICTAVGAGMKSTLKDMKDSMFFWGISDIYQYGKGIAASNWEDVNERKKQIIDKDVSKLADKILARNGKIKPGIKTRAFFFVIRLMQRKCVNPSDAEYWKQKGWIDNKRPWK